MAQHGPAGWQISQASSALDGPNGNSNDGGFVGQVDHSTGPYLEVPASHENHFEHLGYAPSTNPYGQQNHGNYAPQHQYSNMGFGVESQHPFPHDMRPLGTTQVVGQSHSNDYQQHGVPYTNGHNLDFRQFHTQGVPGHYAEFAQPQQHVGSSEYSRNSWTEPQSQHSSQSPYSQAQHLYPNNPSLLRVATASPAQSPTPKPAQNPSYQVDQAPAYQPQTYGGSYQAPQSSESRHTYQAQVPFSAALAPAKSSAAPTQSPGPGAAASHSVPWPPQGQALRLGSAPTQAASAPNTSPSVPRPPTVDQSRPASKLSGPATSVSSGDATIIVPRRGKPGEGWKSVKGCPNLFMGATPVRRQVVTSITGVKPHVAGDNRNGTRLLPQLPNPLPCEVLRERVRPVIDELDRITENIKRTKAQMEATSVGSEEHKKYADDLRKSESRKASLESEKKRITGKAGVWKTVKSRATGKSEVVEDDSESLTDSSEEDDPQELIVQQIMATGSRPADPEKAVQYDVVRMIRHEFSADQGGASQGEKEDPWSKVIGRRVADFGKYVVDMCAEAKTLREQKANAPKSQSSQLQAAIDQKYELVRLALDAALEFGDEETLRNMGQHMKLMSGLTIALSRQFANKTYNTDFPKTILRFMSEATLMDLEVFQKVKLSAVLEKHGINLDDEGKQLVGQISKNAEERTAKNGGEKPTAPSQTKQKPLENVKNAQASSTQKAPTPSKSSSTGSKLQPSQLTSAATQETARKETKAYSGLISARKVSNNIGKPAVTASPTKRQRDDDADSRAAKKVAVETTAGQMGTARTVSASLSSSATPPTSTSSNGQPRPRPSGSTVLNKSRLTPKPPAKKAESQSSAVSSTISGLLAEIAKPAEKPKPQERPVKISETAEERTRRLRKESRRGRTVSWKPEDELVQVRYFEHDTNEDEGRGGNMIRDARDNRLEGQMLKQMQRSMQDGDDEEDGNPSEMEIRTWVTPRAIDYSLLDNNQREKNFITRGGIREVNSEQKKIMEEYENRELMSIYTTLSEIPDTPRSPARKTSEPFVQPRQSLLPSGNPKTHEIQLRWSESRQFGATAASQAALRRLGSTSKLGTVPTLGYASTGPKTAPSPDPAAGRLMTQEERDAHVLTLLQSQRAKHYTDPNPYDPAKLRIVQPPETRDEKVQKAFSIIQSIVDQYKDIPTSHLEKPQWSAEDQARKIAESNQGQYSAYQANQFATYQTLAQTLQQTQSYSQPTTQVPDQYAAILQQVQALQNPQAAQNPMAPQPTPVQPDNGLATLLATLSRSAQPAQATPLDPNLTAWQTWAQGQAQSYGTQSQIQPQAQSYAPHSQQYDGATGDESSYASHKQGYQSQGQYQRDSGERGNRKDYKEFNRATKDHKGINRALIGTKPCTFWAKGQCAKGDNCTFRHDPNDLK